MEVTDVLRDRMQRPGGLQRTITLSAGAHLALAGALVFAPGGLLQHRSRPNTVMTISLGGGGTGPENGGMTAMGGRPVQEVKPPAAPPSEVKSAPDEARGRTPTRGAEKTAGSAVADTGVRGQGFGLSSGGGPGSGSTLDVADFCCPEYLATMMLMIRRAWNQNQGATGVAVVKFTIQRDGRLTNVEVFKKSGIETLDIAAQRAVLATRSLPPLPDAFPNPTLTVRLNFEYQ